MNDTVHNMIMSRPELQGLSEEQQQMFIEQLNNKLFENTIMKLLTPEEQISFLGELDTFMDQNPEPQAVHNFIQQKVPGYQETYEEDLKKILS
jgi:hypothetical protein